MEKLIKDIVKNYIDSIVETKNPIVIIKLINNTNNLDKLRYEEKHDNLYILILGQLIVLSKLIKQNITTLESLQLNQTNLLDYLKSILILTVKSLTNVDFNLIELDTPKEVIELNINSIDIKLTNYIYIQYYCSKILNKSIDSLMSEDFTEKLLIEAFLSDSSSNISISSLKLAINWFTIKFKLNLNSEKILINNLNEIILLPIIEPSGDYYYLFIPLFSSILRLKIKHFFPSLNIPTTPEIFLDVFNFTIITTGLNLNCENLEKECYDVLTNVKINYFNRVKNESINFLSINSLYISKDIKIINVNTDNK